MWHSNMHVLCTYSRYAYSSKILRLACWLTTWRIVTKFVTFKVKIEKIANQKEKYIQ